jgi:hypothetical protein
LVGVERSGQEKARQRQAGWDQCFASGKKKKKKEQRKKKEKKKKKRKKGSVLRPLAMVGLGPR